jgi:hypothetical protein
MATEDNLRAQSTEIVPVAPQAAVVTTTTELETSIQGFNAPLAGFLTGLGLPTENVLVDFAERRFNALSVSMNVHVGGKIG